MDDSRITTVYVFDNGLVAVWDQYGKRMPNYEGHTTDVRDLILADAPTTTIYLSMNRWRYDPALNLDGA